MPRIVQLIWADFIVGSLILVIGAFSKNANASSMFGVLMSEVTISPLAFSACFIVFNFLFTLVIAYKMSEGRKWTRKTYLVSCLMTLAPIAANLGPVFSDSKLLGLLSVAQCGIEIYALILIFAGAGKAHFVSHAKD